MRDYGGQTTRDLYEGVEDRSIAGRIDAINIHSVSQDGPFAPVRQLQSYCTRNALVSQASKIMLRLILD